MQLTQGQAAVRRVKMSKSREFVVSVDGEDKTLLFSSPNQENMFEIDKHYRKIYSEAIREGIMTEAEARKRFQASEAWTKLDESSINTQSNMVAELELFLEAEKDPDKASEIAANLAEIRADLLESLTMKNEIFAMTAEMIALEQKMHKFCELCCTDDKGDRLFSDSKSYQEFSETNPSALSTVFAEAHIFEFEIPEDMTSDWGEVKFVQNLVKEAEAKEAKKSAKKTRARKTKTKTTKK